MSSELENPPLYPPPAIPNGCYHLQFGHNVGVEGAYLTTGEPGSQATLNPLGHPGVGKDQEFNVVYDKNERTYVLMIDARRGISYDKDIPGGRVITSKSFPHFFDITKVDDIIPPPAVEVYRIGIGGNGHQELVIGMGPETITPPLLELRIQSPSLGAVWQFHRVKVEETGGE